MPAKANGNLKRQEKNRFSLSQSVLWGAIILAGFSVIIALILPRESGPAAFVLTFGIAAVLFVVMYAMAAGNMASRQYAPGGRVHQREDAPFALGALEAMPEPVLVTGRRGEPVFANAAYRTLTEAAGAMGQSIRPVPFERLVGAHPGLSAVTFRLTRAARNQQSAYERLPVFESEAGMCELDVHIAPLPEGGALWRIVDRSRLNADRDDNPAPQSGLALLEEAPVGFFSTDQKGRVSYMNTTLRNWLGLGDGVPPPTVQSFASAEADRLLNPQGKGVTRVDVKLKTRDGIETPAVVVTRWAKGKNGTHSRSIVFGNGRGLAPLAVNRTEGANAQSIGRSLDEMFYASPFGVARLDGANPQTAIIEDANPALLEMTGGKATPGAAFLSLFTEEGPGRDALLAMTNGGGGPFDLALKAEGNKAVHIYMAPDHAGRAIAYVIDMSSWKAMETDLFQAQKMQAIGQLAGGVAHDLNNVLTAIRMNCDHLLSRHMVGDPSYPELQKINEDGLRAAALVDNLLTFSRKKTVRLVPLNLSTVLNDFTHMLRRMMHESIPLDVVLGRDLPVVRADKGQIEMAVMNLATNARDAMMDTGGGKLIIRTSRQDNIPCAVVGEGSAPDGAWALIEVVDTGTGMDEKTLARIFEPFFTTKDMGKGTGLGLANVQGIIKQSSGYLFPISTPGEGTVFQIWLPECTDVVSAKVQNAALAAPKERKPKDLAGRGRILFVEDEDSVRTIAVKILANRGYDVLEAADGEEALEIAKENAGKIDLMISDVVMPGMDGPRLLEEARPYLKDARIVFISGFAQEEFSDTLSKDADISFLPKPFSLKQLAEKVKEELSS
ncbi:MAG: hybrid sensor histidine kinase/response regulator [Robiginitomaculum sp.]|nr:MAG: hybrid sensor histidine kinase/response regulator [Robiginitomaculum sp.]